MGKSDPLASFDATLLGDLPTERFWGAADLYQWKGFWYYLTELEATRAAQLGFAARDDDVILASSMKTGTTWLKALLPCIMNNNASGMVGGNNDPFLKSHPNELTPSLEYQIFKKNSDYNISEMPSPRLFRTHIPYFALPESIKTSGCKIVYITRNPKDVFVSLWHFLNALAEQVGVPPCPIKEAFESFCRGVHFFGPFHDHVLEFWKMSLENPGKILFMKYEEMKKDPRGQVKKLASFLGRPFANEDELDKVLWRCSLERLKNLEINKEGIDPWTKIPYKAYFRKGVVGDWENSLSEEMKEQLDEITRKKFKGTGIKI